jgi:hypothetical protein
MRVGQEGLRPPGPPLHRAAEPARRPQHHRRFREALAAEPEAAAGVGRGDAQLLGRHLQDVARHRVAHAEHALARRGELVALGFGVPGADRDAGLHRVADHAVLHQLDPRDMRGAGEGSVGLVLAAVAPVHAEVRSAFRPDHRRAGVERPGGVGDGGQHLVLHDDQLQSVLGLAAGLRHDRDDGVADIAHGVGLQDRPRRAEQRRRAGARRHLHLHLEQPDAVGRGVVPGQHQQHAGRGARGLDIQRQDAGMRMRGAQDRQMRLAGQVHVVGVAPATGEEAHVLLPPHGLADAELVHCSTPHPPRLPRPARRCARAPPPSAARCQRDSPTHPAR